jgi:capping protein alpha
VDLSAARPLRVAGKISLHAHYFENGNLQLQSEKLVDEELPDFTTIGLGDALLSVMKTAEDAVQAELEDMYINMSQETFKEMRRVMPVTQTKMEWSLHAHRTARDLGGRK